MQKQKRYRNSGFGVVSKKKYSKPELIVIGKVSELTAGGSAGVTEDSAPKNPGCESNSKNKMRC